MKVIAIRGAITVDNNDTVEIIDNTKELLNVIIEKNVIDINEVISIVFTMTKDLNAAFPAVAARQIGWTNIPLMCMQELDIPGSLEKCIRVLLHINSEKSKLDVKHVYLKNAKVLRPDLVD